MKKPARKAVVYARVSTKDQEEFGHSIPAQLKGLHDYAARQGFEVIKEFAFSESAGPKIRKKFEEVMAYLRERAGREDTPVLLCQNVDRVTRNFRDTADLDDMRRNDGLEIHFVQEGFVLNRQSSGSELFMWEAKAFLAKQYINRLTDDAMRSLRHKLENGECISKAPIDYLNTRDEHGRATVILDQERFMAVRKLFTEYAKGTYTIGEMTRKAAQWGLRNKTRKGGKLTVSQLHGILQNRFYCGQQFYNGQWYDHKYPRLIDPETFDACQQVRLGWKKKPFLYSDKPFVFRGLLTCGHCGCVYCSELKKGKYVYLACTKRRNPDCPAPRVKEEQLFNQLAEVFDRMAFPAAIMPDIRTHLGESNAAKKEFRDNALKNLQGEQSGLKRKLDNLLDALISERITQSEYDEKASSLKQRQHEIQQQLRGFTVADDDFAVSVKLLLELVNHAGALFRSSSVEQKRKLITLVCQNLTLTDGTIGYTLKKPFELFLQEPKKKVWLGD